MDTIAYILIFAGGVAWLMTRKHYKDIAQLALLFLGAGLGVFGSAVYFEWLVRGVR